MKIDDVGEVDEDVGGGRTKGAVAPLDSSPALVIASTKSRAAKGWELGPTSRSREPLRIRILCRAEEVRIASPTPLRMMEGRMEV